MAGLRYVDAGVDVEAGNRLVERIRSHAESTKTPWSLGGIGGFAGLSALPSGFTEPLLVSGTDGVGTKLKVAFATGRHDTVGEDLVAMCVNDILTVGAKPLFFLDYFGTGRLQVEQAEAVVAGIARGCREAECALLGGETAELPDLYQDGEYDLAGFCVGVVEKSAVLDGSRVRTGDRILGVAARGLHSNGYSLARKVLLEHAGLSLDATTAACCQEAGVDATGVAPDERLADTLLRPTPIYHKLVQQLLGSVSVHALCHVTGGGIVENLPRVLPSHAGAHLRLPESLPIFELIRALGSVAEAEMFRTFNMGVGLMVVCDPAEAEAALQLIEAAGERSMDLGAVVENTDHRVHFGQDAP